MNHHAPQTVAAIGSLFRRGTALAAGGTLTAALLLSACTKTESGKSAQGAALTADRAMVKKASFDITTTASGELEAKNQIEIRSQLETQSTIVKIVDEGVIVKKGQVLIELNADKIDGQLIDAQIALDAASAEKMTAANNHKIQLTDNTNKIRQAELKVTLAQLTLEQWQQGEVKKKNQEIKLAIEKAERDLNRLNEKYDRSKDLLSKGFLSRNDFQLDEIAKIEAEAAVQKAALEKTIYDEYTYKKEFKKNQSEVEDGQAEVERTRLNAESELANKVAALHKAEEQLKRRQESLDKLQKQKAACTIIAPSDGLVVYGTSLERSRWGYGGDGPLQVGREVFPNMLLMVLPDTSEMVASVKVQESLAGRIQPGLVASIKVDAAGGRTFSGKVESIGVLAESGGWRDPNLREYTVKISLANVEEGSGLKPSMRCESQIVMGKVDEVPSVPVQAVFNDGAVRFVYANEGAKFSRVPVKLGRRSETTAEISAGLTENQVVLLREPSPGEVLSRPWDKDMLLAAGYALGEDGLPFVSGERGQGGQGGKSGGGKSMAGKGGPAKGAAPKGDPKPGAAPEPATRVATKPEAGDSNAAVPATVADAPKAEAPKTETPAPAKSGGTDAAKPAATDATAKK